ncbi:hypothetical protein QR685DRAFT_436685, partial [Neurospora intermedia]
IIEYICYDKGYDPWTDQVCPAIILKSPQVIRRHQLVKRKAAMSHSNDFYSLLPFFPSSISPFDLHICSRSRNRSSGET